MLDKSARHVLTLFVADIPPRIIQVVFFTFLSIYISSSNFARYGEILAYSATFSLFLSFGLTALFPLDYNNSIGSSLSRSNLVRKYVEYIIFLLLLSLLVFIAYVCVYLSFSSNYVSFILLLILFSFSRSLILLLLTINRLVCSGSLLVFVSYTAKLPSLVFPLLALILSANLPFLNTPKLEVILIIDIFSTLFFLPLSLFLIYPGLLSKVSIKSCLSSIIRFLRPSSFHISFSKDCLSGLSFILPQLLLRLLLTWIALYLLVSSHPPRLILLFPVQQFSHYYHCQQVGYHQVLTKLFSILPLNQSQLLALTFGLAQYFLFTYL